jgi:hypothetical protein
MTFRVLHGNVFWINRLCKQVISKAVIQFDASTTPLALQTPLVASIDIVEDRQGSSLA